jgi:hypothetical protein
MLKLSARFVAMLVIATVAVGSLITSAEMVLHAPLSFGLAMIVVLPMLLASRSCGAAWVQAHSTKAGFGIIVRYGIWFASLSLLLAAFLAAIMIQFHWLNAPSAENLASLINRPLDSLSILLLAVATCTLITCTGFALGVRAEIRQLPNT